MGESSGQRTPRHAFDEPEFRSFLEQSHPEFCGLIDLASRPSISSRPDELEQWEAERILQRKQRFSYEEPEMFLRRLLYEEMFSVNQRPDLEPPDTLHGVAGMTPGGLISHNYPGYTNRRFTLEDALELDETSEPTLIQALQEVHQRNQLQAQDLFEVAHSMVYPDILSDPTHPFARRRIFERGLNGNVPDRYETVAYRMMKMLRAAPEMMGVVQDKDLQARFTAPTTEISRARLLVLAWHNSQSLLPDGYYTSADTSEVRAAVDNLLAFRTHLEMKVFFKFLSPSGYINDSNTEVS